MVGYIEATTAPHWCHFGPTNNVVRQKLRFSYCAREDWTIGQDVKHYVLKTVSIQSGSQKKAPFTPTPACCAEPTAIKTSASNSKSSSRRSGVRGDRRDPSKATHLVAGPSTAPRLRRRQACASPSSADGLPNLKVPHRRPQLSDVDISSGVGRARFAWISRVEAGE